VAVEELGELEVADDARHRREAGEVDEGDEQLRPLAGKVRKHAQAIYCDFHR
jgi:hypothetical protein